MFSSLISWQSRTGAWQRELLPRLRFGAEQRGFGGSAQSGRGDTKPINAGRREPVISAEGSTQPAPRETYQEINR